MNKALHNRIKQAETAAAFIPRQHQRSGMGELYRRMNQEPDSLGPQFQRMLGEMTTAELLEQSGYHVDKDFDLSSVPTEILLKIRDSRAPDKVLTDWIGSQQ